MSSQNVTDSRPSDATERERQLLILLQRSWTYAFSTKSDLAREYADEISEAASRGFMTTLVAPNGTVHGRLWKITPKGLCWLYQLATPEFVQAEEVSYVTEYSA